MIRLYYHRNAFLFIRLDSHGDPLPVECRRGAWRRSTYWGAMK